MCVCVCVCVCLIPDPVWSTFAGKLGGAQFFICYTAQICDEIKDFTLNRGSEEHMADIFNRVKLCDAFQKKGERVKLGRWASWLRATKSWRAKKMQVLLVLVWAGTKRGWWKSFADLPLLSPGGADVADDAAPGAPMAAPSGSASSIAADPAPSASGAASSSASGGAAAASSDFPFAVGHAGAAVAVAASGPK